MPPETREIIEAQAAEAYAKENGLWIPMERIAELGTPGTSSRKELFVIFAAERPKNVDIIKQQLEAYSAD